MKLLDKSGNVVRVRGLDAIDDSPRIDIEPHTYSDPKKEDSHSRSVPYKMIAAELRTGLHKRYL